MPVFVASLVGIIVTALTQFVASRAGMILAGLGLTFVGVKGFETFMGFVIADINQVTSYVQSAGGSAGNASGLGALMVQFAAYAGLFDALNIVISGYMAFASLSGLAFTVRRLSK